MVLFSDHRRVLYRFQVIRQVLLIEEELRTPALQSESVVHHYVFQNDGALVFPFIDKLGAEHFINALAPV